MTVLERSVSPWTYHYAELGEDRRSVVVDGIGARHLIGHLCQRR